MEVDKVSCNFIRSNDDLRIFLAERGEMRTEALVKFPFKDVVYDFKKSTQGDVHSLYYAMELRPNDTNPNRYLCGVVGCNQLLGFNGNNKSIQDHADFHKEKLNKLLASGVAPSKPISMGVSSVLARFIVLYAIKERLSVNSANSRSLVSLIKQSMLSVMRPFLSSNPPIFHAIMQSSYAAIQQSTFSSLTVLFADATRSRLRDIVTDKETLAVHIATDNWTRFGSHYCGIVGYVVRRVNDLFVRTPFLLGLPFFDSTVQITGARIHDLITSSLRYLNLPAPLLRRIYLADGARTNTVCSQIADAFDRSLMIACAAHMLSNAGKAATAFCTLVQSYQLFIDRCVGGIRSHARLHLMICELDLTLRKASNSAAAPRLKLRKLVLSVVTRWLSFYDVLNRFLDMREAIKRVLEGDGQTLFKATKNPSKFQTNMRQLLSVLSDELLVKELKSLNKVFAAVAHTLYCFQVEHSCISNVFEGISTLFNTLLTSLQLKPEQVNMDYLSTWSGMSMWRSFACHLLMQLKHRFSSHIPQKLRKDFPPLDCRASTEVLPTAFSDVLSADLTDFNFLAPAANTAELVTIPTRQPSRNKGQKRSATGADAPLKKTRGTLPTVDSSNDAVGNAPTFRPEKSFASTSNAVPSTSTSTFTSVSTSDSSVAAGPVVSKLELASRWLKYITPEKKNGKNVAEDSDDETYLYPNERRALEALYDGNEDWEDELNQDDDDLDDDDQDAEIAGDDGEGVRDIDMEESEDEDVEMDEGEDQNKPIQGGTSTTARVKKRRGRKPGINPHPSIFFAKTVPIVDVVYIHPQLSTDFNPTTASMDEFRSVLFGCAIVLDLRINLASRPPYHFDPKISEILHCFKLFLAAIPSHFKSESNPNQRRPPVMTNPDPDDSFDIISPEFCEEDEALLTEVNYVLSNRNSSANNSAKDEMKSPPMLKWNEKRKDGNLPLLYPLAAFLLSIPLGSVDVERLFSRMRNRLPYNKSRTAESTVGDRAMVAENFDQMLDYLEDIAQNTSIRKFDISN